MADKNNFQNLYIFHHDMNYINHDEIIRENAIKEFLNTLFLQNYSILLNSKYIPVQLNGDISKRINQHFDEFIFLLESNQVFYNNVSIIINLIIKQFNSDPFFVYCGWNQSSSFFQEFISICTDKILPEAPLKDNTASYIKHLILKIFVII